MQLISLSADQLGPRRIYFPPAVHLTSDELEARDLIFRLAVGLGRSDCRPNRRFIPSDAAGARGNETGACALVEVSPASAFCRTIKWNSVIISRASAKVSTPASVTATLRVYAFVSKSRPIIMGARSLADGIL